jgi:hypothetical protein
MKQLKRILLVLTPMGAAAFFGGGGTYDSFAELANWSPARKREGAASNRSLRSTKRVLLAAMLIGGAAYLGFGGTFANFQAETSNGGNSISSGTLTLNNTVNNSATACASYLADSHDNLRRNCDTALSISNVAPGVVGASATAKIQIANGGSIDGRSLYLWAPFPNGKLTTAITGTTASPATPGSIAVSGGMEGVVSSGDTISVAYGGKSSTFTVNGTVTPASNSNGGATSIPVSGSTTLTFPIGATVTDTSADTNASTTNCYDSQYTSGLTAGASYGSQLNFNPLTGNPLCSSVLMYVQEITGSYSYCWFGLGSSQSGYDAGWGAFTEFQDSTHSNASAGKCVAPIYNTTSSSPTGSGVTSINVGTGNLNGNVVTGDTIQVTSGTTVSTFTASAAATFGASSISINSATVPAAFANGATVVDTTQQTKLDNDGAQSTQYDTVSAFDTGHNFNATKLELSPLTGNGAIDSSINHAVELAHGASRTFYIGLYVPKPSSLNQNYLQGLFSTFGLTWHMDQ